MSDDAMWLLRLLHVSFNYFIRLYRCMAERAGLLTRVFMPNGMKKDRKITYAGEYVKSEGERRIANHLYERGISYQYEPRMRLNGNLVVPDFFLTGWTNKLLIEFWGMSTPEYLARKQFKKRLYATYSPYPLIDVQPEHLRSLDDYLEQEILRKRKGWLHT